MKKAYKTLNQLIKTPRVVLDIFSDTKKLIYAIDASQTRNKQHGEAISAENR